MASVFPLLETIQFDTSTYSLENQARMISSQPSWRDYMTQLKSEPMDTALFDNPSDNIHQLKHEEDWFEAGRLLINWSGYFLRDPARSFEDSYDLEERKAIVSQIANQVCGKHVELYSQLLIAKNNYEIYKTQKATARKVEFEKQHTA